MFDESSNVQFPWKLHVLLDEAERNGYSHVISWLPSGNAFKVHDKVGFAELVMPKYFHSNKYKSFQRNLNLWCFQTLTKEPNKGAIFHPYFLRCNPDRCHLMKRIKVKKDSKRASLAELRASAPPTTLPSPSHRFNDVKAAVSSMSSHGMSALNAAQLMFLAQHQQQQQQQQQQQENEQQSQQLQLQLQRQNWAHNLALLPNLQARSHHLSSLFNMSSAPTVTNKLTTPSPSALNSLLLNQLAQKQQQQAQAASLAGLPSSSMIDLDRIKMQLGLALLVTNAPTTIVNRGVGASSSSSSSK